MNAILGYSETLQEDAAPAARNDLHRIERAGRQLLSLVNDILDLSKVEAGEMDFDLQRVDGAGLVEELADQLQPLFGNHTDLRVQAVNGTCIADERRLRQCLINLLSNAVRFTPKGTVVLGVQPSGADLVFTVEDNGSGMSAEQLAQIFTPFVQVHHGDKGGTGLAIAEPLVEGMQGRVKVESRVGEGTIFTLLFPRA